ncbi:uncharacterized protein CDV56_101445 [Aspergillus thermomutatus]|uniref:Uncharacterized protein n=1 Tax=Aspergillus thermomutatus TaxID=41047 RepID=A0A397GJM0_ASPTH|nr:uncharacterized protein CDV56_101445 [Aspergillus thermomutatus]RHZ49636.1 hypothetical protein CDV56_101445 [Aspergillus thermomutatus]
MSPPGKPSSGDVYLGALAIGQAISPIGNGDNSNSISQEWTIPAGVYTPQQLVHRLSPLLDIVVHRLGPDPPNTSARALLLDTIAATLSTDRRESALHFSPEILNTSRREIMHQAHRIGAKLVSWADQHRGTPSDTVEIRSPCESHQLIPLRVELLFSRRSQPQLLQLFEEYSHQMVLLRDALLPFENFEQTPIPIPGNGTRDRDRGLRYLEAPRRGFLVGLFTKEVAQASVVAFARAVLAPRLPVPRTGGYGFQYKQGLVIPAVLAGSETVHLLRYVAALVCEAEEVLFDYQFEDSDAAPRVEVAGTAEWAGIPPATGEVKRAGLVVGPVRGLIAELHLRLEMGGGGLVAVDVGQIARGHRHAYRVRPSGAGRAPQAFVHQAFDILQHPGIGLVTASGGIHVIPVADRLVALALLGRLYPGNVALLPGDGNLADINMDKRIEPRFVLWIASQ